MLICFLPLHALKTKYEAGARKLEKEKNILLGSV